MNFNTIIRAKTHFVFSGGGARGGWQWDLFSRLEPLFDIETVCGSSTGTLTALCAAKGVPREYMAKLYEDVFANNARQIFKPGVGTIKNGGFKLNDWKLYPKLIFGKNKIKGAMTIDPLIETVARIHKEFPAFKYKFSMAVVDLHTSKTVYLSYEDFEDDREFCRGVAASCAIPILTEPIRDLKTKKGIIKCAVDGGTREGVPLKNAFDQMDPNGENQAILLGCNTPDVTPIEDLANIWGIMGATGTAVLNEMMNDDIQKVELVNDLIGEIKLVGKKYVTIFKIYYKGGRGVLEFTPECLDSMRSSAKEDYERFLKAFPAMA